MKDKKQTKRINIINQYFYPDNAATGQLLYSLSKNLANKGYRIRVLTSYPSYAQNKNKKIVNENQNNLKIKRLFFTNLFFIKKSPKLIKGVIFCLLILKRLLFLNKKKDILLLTSEPPFLPIYGWLIHKYKKIDFIILIYDLYPEILEDTKLIKKSNFIYKLWKNLNYKTFKNCKEIIVLSKETKDKLVINYDLNHEKIKIIPSWADTKNIHPIEKSKNWFVKNNNLKDLFIVLYSGNQGRLHDLDTIIKTAFLLKDENDILFLFIGDGAQNKKLKKNVRDQKLFNCKFLPYQDFNDLKFSLSSGDLGIVSIAKNSLGNIAPSKLYGYLAAGCPLAIISPKDSYLKKLAEQEDLGIWIENRQPEKFAKSILSLKKSKEIQLNFKKNALEYINNHACLEVVSDQYEDIFKKYL